MSYQVLARKYRPKSFATLVGQEHVVRALTHALEQQRLHHAYLFTGTRGVGKTTLSRILAKSFNCEKGITAEACGVCEACTAIDAGRFVDYIEMDAASNRGVDEMASLLEQAIYAPSNARFKVYMIDEVHMLTNHAFNAMLKTLEEPPPHIKFILATTDPQKIPVTVLSRCLQFNLKQMPPGHIVGHLENILGQERIEFELPALRLLAQGAHGSMRDALSLTDQAIAYAAGKVSLDAVQSMLGALDQSYLIRLLQALLDEDGSALLAVADEMAARSLSYKAALQDLATMLHQIAVAQMVPQALAEDVPERASLLSLAEQFNKEEVQLYYQIAVHGRNEIGLAPDEYAGFAMTLLRMLAFRPGRLPAVGSGGSGGAPHASGPTQRGSGSGGIHSAREAMQAATRNQVPVNSSNTISRGPAAHAQESTVARQPEVAVPMNVIEPKPALTSAPAALVQAAGTSTVISKEPPAAAMSLPASPAISQRTLSEPVAPVEDEFAGIRLPPVVAKAEVVAESNASSSSKQLSPAMAALAAARAASGKGAAVSPVAKAPAAEPLPAAKKIFDQNREMSPEPSSPEVTIAVTADVVPGQATVSPTMNRVEKAPVHHDESEMPPPWDESEFDSMQMQAMPPAKQKEYDESDYFAETASIKPATTVAGDEVQDVRAITVPQSQVAKINKPLQLMPVSEINWDGHWPNLAASLPVKGVAQQLAQQSELRQCSMNGGAVVFRLCVPVQTLLSAGSVDKLVAALGERFADTGYAIRVETEIGAVEQTANAQALAERAERQQQAERAIQEDSFVQTLMREFGASILAGSVRPV